ncbi:MAG: hypothetical protein V4530_15050 [Pseudomonadota bacterium]
MVVQSALAADVRLDAASALVTIVADEGSTTHPHVRSLYTLEGAEGSANAADALHHLSMLHGRHPGVVDHAAARTASDSARVALFAIGDNFLEERESLSRLVVAAGPIPSTPGQAASEASVVHQRHAIEMLARSDRQGCATGAALALAIDWHAIRPVMAACARRFGVDLRDSAIPDHDTLTGIARDACTNSAIERALLFGARQIAAQHRALWDLLEARAKARQHY